MNPQIATAACLTAILCLFMMDRDRYARTSPALWIPTAWILIVCSRFVSQWTVTVSEAPTTQQQIEGSPLDRAILTGILLMGIIVLLCRGRRVLKLLRMNAPIILFFAYCLLSILWSDYPDVSLRRWIKGLGDLVVVLIVLTERDRTAAVKKLLARVTFLLIPLSVLFIEYYPSIGQSYSLESGATFFRGVTMNKNECGMLCLIAGLATVWRLTYILRDKYHRTRRLIAHGAILACILWLLFVANSATSLACFLLASAFIVTVNLHGKPRAARIHLIAGATAFAGLLVAIFPETYAFVVHALGRNTTLTDRVSLWHSLLGININPWVGTGFASFWMGNRLDKLWSLFSWQPNEAHNGYLGVYLNLGCVGLSLLAVLLVTGYRNIIASLRSDPEFGSMMIGFYAMAVIYNFTEEAFRLMDPVWIFFLMAIMSAPSFFFDQRSDALQASDEQSIDDLQGAHPRFDEAIV
jgi:exopolysaccharide production protein ExoQ